MEGKMEHFYTVEEVVPVELKNEIDILEKGHCQVDPYAIRSKANQGLEVNKKVVRGVLPLCSS